MELESEEDDPEIQLSLCASAFKSLEPKSSNDLSNIFEEYRISREVFAAKPFELLKDPNLVVKVEDRYFDGQIGIAMILSQVAFKQPLEQ